MPLDAAPSHDVKILMGDFNAQIGPDRTGFKNVMGKEAMGRCTDNGERLLSMCSSNELKVGGSIMDCAVEVDGSLVNVVIGARVGE